MNNFKYIHEAHDGRKTVISGSFLARCIANRTIGGVTRDLRLGTERLGVITHRF